MKLVWIGIQLQIGIRLWLQIGIRLWLHNTD
jgi:hypothetical protein